MQRFGGEKIKSVMSWSGLEEDVPIENRLVTKSISGSQVKVESHHFDIRKHLLNFDDVLNNQRKIIYQNRGEILEGAGLRTKVLEMLRQEFEELARKNLPGRHSDDWTVPGLLDDLEMVCPLPPELATEDQVNRLGQDEVRRILSEYAERAYERRESEVGEEGLNLLSRLLLLRAIDTHWVSHLTAMENLRTGIGLHAYGQRDPLVMYRGEGQKLFQELQQRMQYDVVHTLFHVSLGPLAGGGRRQRSQGNEQTSPMQAVAGARRNGSPSGATKIGRNSPCPCGSGRKYKRCCGANA
jgi:preprotein translocase subunit SecA